MPMPHPRAPLGMHRQPKAFQPLKAAHGHINRHNLIHRQVPILDVTSY